MIDKSGEYGLKGQNISAQGNALGKMGKIKTVCDEKIIDAQNFFRTELLIKYPKKQESSYFVRNYNCSLKNDITRTISTLRIQPRATPWVRISISFREKKLSQTIQNLPRSKMSNDKKNYNSPVQATLTGILNLFRKRSRVGFLSPSERLDDKKILIDGASSGLGLATAIELAKIGGTVIMAVRSGFPEKAEEVKMKSGSQNVFVYQVDFSDFDSIKKLVSEVKAEHGKLDIVICNAAVVAKKGVQTKSGLETMFMVNYLSKFYFIQQLLKNDCINTGSIQIPRIIFVTSESHRNAREFNWRDFGTFIPHGVGKTVELYGYYKLLLVTFARELSRRLNSEGTNYSVFALCPGPVNSNIAREAPLIFKPLLRLVFFLFFRSPEKACEPVLFHAASTLQEGKPFDYLFLMERKAIDEKAENPKNGEKLWKLSEELLKKLKVD